MTLFLVLVPPILNITVYGWIDLQKILEFIKYERVFPALSFLHQKAEEITESTHLRDEYPDLLLELFAEFPAQD